MLIDQIIFFLMIGIYFTITIFTKIKDSFKKSRLKPIDLEKVKEETKAKKNYELFKFILNSYLSFNSVVIGIGFITETYLYGGRLLLNLLSVSIGYLIAFLIVHPVIFNLDKKIKSPYEYLQYRYGDRKSIKYIAASVGIFFYLLFMSLHLWGCSVILSAILPQIPGLFISSILIGVFGTLGSLFQGYVQSFKINLIQFVLLLSGLIAAIVISFTSNKDNKSASDLWQIVSLCGRDNFIVSNGDLITRYTIWNQGGYLFEFIFWLYLKPGTNGKNGNGTFFHYFFSVRNVPFPLLPFRVLGINMYF
jgi:hypothetical protein